MDSTEHPPPPVDYRISESGARNSYIARSPHAASPGQGYSANVRSGSERSFVTQLVNSNPVVVFSKTHCPHCTDTKNILSNKGVNYKTVELDKMQTRGPLVQNVLQEMTSARTVPRIFIDGNCVGGNSDLKKLNETGQLEDLLKSLK